MEGERIKDKGERRKVKGKAEKANSWEKLNHREQREHRGKK
jgi:hypothetical protein